MKNVSNTIAHDRLQCRNKDYYKYQILMVVKIRILALNLMTEDGSKRSLRNIGNYVLICEALRYKSLQ